MRFQNFYYLVGVNIKRVILNIFDETEMHVKNVVLCPSWMLMISRGSLLSEQTNDKIGSTTKKLDENWYSEKKWLYQYEYKTYNLVE